MHPPALIPFCSWLIVSINLMYCPCMFFIIELVFFVLGCRFVVLFVYVSELVDHCSCNLCKEIALWIPDFLPLMTTFHLQIHSYSTTMTATDLHKSFRKHPKQIHKPLTRHILLKDAFGPCLHVLFPKYFKSCCIDMLNPISF